MEGDQEELYKLVRENNKMLRSMRRNAFWGGIFKLLLYVAALAIPVWLYLSYLYPIVKQMDAALTTMTGKKVQLEGQINDWAQLFAKFKDRFEGAASSTKSTQ